MAIQLNLARYQRRERRMIPSSMQNLMNTPYMVEHLVKEIYHLLPDQIRRIGLCQEGNWGRMQGNLSDSGRVQVRVYMRDGLVQEHHWFVKIMPECEQRGSGLCIFKNEIEFYQRIVPVLREFVLGEGFDHDFADFDVPEILYSNYSEAEGAILVLRDVMTDGYVHEKDENDDKFLSAEQALTAVCSIAKLHAVSVAMQERRKMNLSTEYPTLMESGLLWTQAEMTSRLALIKDSYCELLKQCSELDSHNLLTRFRNSFDSDERLVQLCEQRCRSCYKLLSIQHGDFHFNNLMFKKGEDGRLRLKIVDWQLTYTGTMTGDLSYLLLSSLSPQTRELFEDDIKSEYFSTYISTLRRFSRRRCIDKEEEEGLEVRSDVLGEYSKDSLVKEFNSSLPLSFFLSCGNIMSADCKSQESSVRFSYNMCKEAATRDII